MDYKLVEFLDEIREHFDAKMTINSGCRCLSHNASVSGAEKSWHMQGRAADVVVEGVPPAIIAALAIQMHVPGVGEYATFTHLDTRSGDKWRG